MLKPRLEQRSAGHGTALAHPQAGQAHGGHGHGLHVTGLLGQPVGPLEALPARQQVAVRVLGAGPGGERERETGALKRRRATPVQPAVLIGSDVVTTEVSALTIAIVLSAVGWAVFGVHLTAAGAGAVIATTVIGTAALCGVAYAVATLIKSIDSAAPLVMLVMFTLNAISGIYIPENLFPAWLRAIAQVLPIRPLAEAMQAAFDPRTNGGRYFAWPDLLIVAAWGVAGALFAVRRFSWSPSQH